MIEYTQEEVLESLLKITKNSRKRVLVDQRSYLIGVLAFKFRITEHRIALLTGYNRYTINYNKRLPVQFCKDPQYLANVYVYAQRFPFDFSQISTQKINRDVKVNLSVDKKTYRKLKAAGIALGHKDVRTTIKLLIEKSMKIWDE